MGKVELEKKLKEIREGKIFAAKAAALAERYTDNTIESNITRATLFSKASYMASMIQINQSDVIIELLLQKK
jgi:hypothetical protein